MALFKSSTRSFGLDIGSDTVRVVEIAPGKPNPRLVNVGAAKLSKGLVVDGEISNIAEVAAIIRQLWRDTGLQGKRVTVGVANPKVIARQVDLPYMDTEALRGAIRFQAQEYVPISPQNLILDYHVIGETSGDDGSRMLRVLLVAAHRDMIEAFTTVVQRAGLTPWTVYLSSLALVRALIKPDPLAIAVEGGISPVVVVNMGAGLSNVVVVDQGFTRFARVITFGGDDLTRSIAELIGIETKEAEELKIQYGLPGMEGEDNDGEQAQAVKQLLQREAYKFVDEVRRSIEYYFAQDISSLNISKIMLTGGAAQMRNFPEFISEALGIDVILGNPFEVVDVDDRIHKRGILERIAPLSLAPAIGLGLRGLGQ